MAIHQIALNAFKITCLSKEVQEDTVFYLLIMGALVSIPLVILVVIVKHIINFRVTIAHLVILEFRDAFLVLLILQRAILANMECI
jgi:hypothetical protein